MLTFIQIPRWNTVKLSSYLLGTLSLTFSARSSFNFGHLGMLLVLCAVFADAIMWLSSHRLNAFNICDVHNIVFDKLIVLFSCHRFFIRSFFNNPLLRVVKTILNSTWRIAWILFMMGRPMIMLVSLFIWCESSKSIFYVDTSVYVNSEKALAKQCHNCCLYI